ncbi:MAG: ATP-binding protein [Bacteroidota bacterium]
MTEFKRTFANTTACLHGIRAFVREKAQGMGFGEDDLDRIELAVDEACANVVEHAYPEGQVVEDGLHLCLRLDYGKLTIVIADRGVPFDAKSIQNPDMEEYLAEMRIGGLGIYLMRTLMDQVDYDTKPGQNEVKLVKYLVRDDDRKSS